MNYKEIYHLIKHCLSGFQDLEINEGRKSEVAANLAALLVVKRETECLVVFTILEGGGLFTKIKIGLSPTEPVMSCCTDESQRDERDRQYNEICMHTLFEGP